MTFPHHDIFIHIDDLTKIFKHHHLSIDEKFEQRHFSTDENFQYYEIIET